MEKGILLNKPSINYSYNNARKVYRKEEALLEIKRKLITINVYPQKKKESKCV